LINNQYLLEMLSRVHICTPSNVLDQKYTNIILETIDVDNY